MKIEVKSNEPRIFNPHQVILHEAQAYNSLPRHDPILSAEETIVKPLSVTQKGFICLRTGCYIIFLVHNSLSV